MAYQLPIDGYEMGEPLFRVHDLIRHRNTLEIGTILAPPELDCGEYWYKVRFPARIDHVVEENLDPVSEGEDLEDLARAGKWGTLRAFRCALTLYRLVHVNRSTVYSFNGQRIQFEPYQYKPLLKLLDSPDRRLLIADEVGLGKTIEAGIVLAELEARQRKLARVLVVCPSRLRDKWYQELHRKFRQRFEIVDAARLRDYFRRSQEDPDDSPLRAIVSMQTLRRADLRESMAAAVPSIDLVIVDEAHHGRNRGRLTQEMLESLGQIGDAVLFLTATPLQLGTDDLFTLLNALRPAEFRDSGVLQRTLEIHRGVLEAARLLRSGSVERLLEVREKLAAVERIARVVGPVDPRLVQLLNELRNGTPEDKRGWVELQRRTLALHPLDSIVTRTRKRDVQRKAPVRNAKVLTCQWTPEEAEAYEKFVGVPGRHGWFQDSLSLGQIQRARQAASSIHAALLKHAGLSFDDDSATELTDILPSECSLERGGDDHSPGLASPAWLPKRDTKLEKLREILDDIWTNNPKEKVLIFTFFVGTAEYLAEQLSRTGHAALHISGKVRSDPNDPEEDERGRRLDAFRNDPDMHVLVSTEVGSEGLDFQFCRHLVNFDLPWNPMVVEQRIGRIDRFGQQADAIYIHNLVVEGTVEEQILWRLYDRIHIFEQSIGDLEAILGETVRELQASYLNGKLTPEQAELLVEQAARAIQNRQIDSEELQNKASELFGHEEFINEEMSRVRTLGRFITPDALRSLLETYFQSNHPDVRIYKDGDIWCFRLVEKLDFAIRRACQTGDTWRHTPGKIVQFTFDGDRAFEQPSLELMNTGHPLVRVAVDALRGQLDNPSALLGKCTVQGDEGCSVDGINGLFYVAVFGHRLTGIFDRLDLEAVAWSMASGQLLDSTDAEKLLHLAASAGREWIGESDPPAVPEDVWSHLMSRARASNRRIEREKRTEADAIYSRRKTALLQELEVRREQIEGRKRTAELRGSHPQVVRLFQNQLRHLSARFQDRLQLLEDGKEVRVDLTGPVAVCVVEVR